MSNELPTTADGLQALARRHEGLLVLFTEDHCRVADAVEPRLTALISARFPLMQQAVISRDQAPALVAELGIFLFPTVVLWFDGRESSRYVRNFSLEAVADAIERPYHLLFGAAAAH
jgi:thioredoxin-like negative regulator of GroEL